MTGQQLKNSILQWAIQGKLVPQIESEGTAENLLKEIRAEKEKLAKAGKLKKKDLEVISVEDDDKLFEIPDSWSWARIGDIFIHASGKQLAGGKDKGTPRQYITTSNLYWNRFVLDTLKVMCFTDDEVKNSSATKGDLLVCEGGAGYGRSAIWSYDYDICLQNHVHRLRPLFKGASEYVYYIMYYLKESNQLDSVGTAMPGLSAGKLKMIPIPLPPLSEQHRIVAKIEELMPLVEEYGKAQEQLEALNKELPEKLKKSVLQEAIMGKLVPQDPNEGTADELLTEIRKEKEKLVKAGKLKKKDLEVKSIEDDEVPFEIPEGWRWCRLVALGITETGTTPLKSHPEYFGNHIPFLGPANILDNRIISETQGLSDIGILYGRVVPSGTILQVCIGGSIGKCAIVNKNVTFNQQINSITPVKCSVEYLFYVLQSETFRLTIMEKATGTATPIINRGNWEQLLIPLPPLAEQKRIVAKLEEVMREIEGMR